MGLACETNCIAGKFAGKKFGELFVTVVKTKSWRKKNLRFHTASFVYAYTKTALKKISEFLDWRFAFGVAVKFSRYTVFQFPTE